MLQTLPPHSIRPAGWLRQQLNLQAAGLAGHLDEIWPDIRDISWLGGPINDPARLERLSLWLDGLIPLALLLKDEALLAKARRCIDEITARQRADGWLYPIAPEEVEGIYNVWSLFMMEKVLGLYCEATGDEAVWDSLYRSVKCLYELIQSGVIVLEGWALFRWFEMFLPIRCLYNRKREAWLLDFARMLRQKGTHYPDYADQWKRPLNQWKLETHLVNLVMMLKAEPLCCELFGEPYHNTAEQVWQTLAQYNGTAVGSFTGDECLAGIGNTHGTELCSIVEAMYSCELLYHFTGDPVWMERVEKLAFNALPATLSDDMWTHQYDQMVNQIACQRFPGKSFFRTNSSEAHLFGLQPHFPCCTANFTQGWPKLCLNAVHQDEKGLVCSLMLPLEADVQVGGVPVTLRMETEYPFRHGCRYVVRAEKPVAFALNIRIPGWAKAVRVDGKPVEKQPMLVFDRTWEGECAIEIALADEPHFQERPHDLRTVEYGPLVFALPLNAEWQRREYVKDGVERKFPYCDYELTSADAWNYGFASPVLTVQEQPIGEIPFSQAQPPVSILAELSQVPWDFADGYDTVPADVPAARKAITPAQRRVLVPYGAAKLRMTELPMLEKEEQV